MAKAIKCLAEIVKDLFEDSDELDFRKKHHYEDDDYRPSTYYKSSIQDEKSLALFVKDTIDSNEDGLIFTKWYATMCRLGIPINWEDML